MSWKKVKQMFPNGQIPNSEGTLIEDLIDSAYDIADSYRVYYARNMVTKIIQHIWNKNGNHTQEIKYDITFQDMPDDFSCLNTYGKKMLKDYIQNEKNVEEAKNDRFNYTGI